MNELAELRRRVAELEAAEAERKRVEEALRLGKVEYRTVFENTGTATIIAEEDTTISLVNQEFERLSGYSREEVEGKKRWTEFVAPEDLARMKEHHESRRMYPASAPRNYEFRAVDRQGTIKQILLTIATIPGTNKSVASLLDLTERKKTEERLERSFVDLAETISRAEAYRDPYTSLHQRRVAQLIRPVGEKMGLDEDRLLGLEIGGLLHDIGKASIPESILNKPGPLSQQEWSLVRLHARRGYEILQVSNLPWPVAEMALHHHERLDGSGYPDGIGNDELTLDIRILAACNVAEAMSAHRPYRPARSRTELAEELRGGRGTKYDAAVVDILVGMVEAGALELEGQGP